MVVAHRDKKVLEEQYLRANHRSKSHAWFVLFCVPVLCP
jgi:hypothetical protein